MGSRAGFFSPRSIPPMWLLAIPVRRASASCEIPRAPRSSRAAARRRVGGLQSYAHFAADDLLSEVVLERMLAGVATRRPVRNAEPVGKALIQAATSTGRSGSLATVVKETGTVLSQRPRTSGGRAPRRPPAQRGTGGGTRDLVGSGRLPPQCCHEGTVGLASVSWRRGPQRRTLRRGSRVNVARKARGPPSTRSSLSRRPRFREWGTRDLAGQWRGGGRDGPRTAAGQPAP